MRVVAARRRARACLPISCSCPPMVRAVDDFDDVGQGQLVTKADGVGCARYVPWRRPGSSLILVQRVVRAGISDTNLGGIRGVSRRSRCCGRRASVGQSRCCSHGVSGTV